MHDGREQIDRHDIRLTDHGQAFKRGLHDLVHVERGIETGGEFRDERKVLRQVLQFVIELAHLGGRSVDSGLQIQGAPDGIFQTLDIDRLDQIIADAPVLRLHSRIQGAITSDDKDLLVRQKCLDALYQLQAVHARHPHIADHQVKGLLLQRNERSFAVRGAVDDVSFPAQDSAEAVKYHLFVINEQDGLWHIWIPFEF